jgi:hypothetical protein
MEISEAFSQGRVMVDERFGSGQKLVIDADVELFSSIPGLGFAGYFSLGK